MGLLAGGVQHGSQDRVVPGPGRAAEAAGDFLLDLEGSQRPFRFIVGGRNRGIAGEPQHVLLVVLQPEHPVVAPSSFPLAPAPFRGRRRPGFVPGEPGGHDAVIAPPDPVGQPRRQGLSIRQVHGVDGPPEPSGPRRGPGLIITIDPVLEFAQEMRRAEGGHGHAGRIPHDVAAAGAHADAGLVPVFDRDLCHRIPDMEGEAGEPFAGPCHQSRDGALRHPHAEQVDPCLAQPLHRGGPSARTACDR